MIRIAKATCKLLKACKLSWRIKLTVTVKTLILPANLLQALPRRLCCCGSHFRSFQAEHSASGYRKQYTSSLISGLSLWLFCFLMHCWSGSIACNSCAIYGASKHDKSCLLLSKSFSFYILRISMWKISKRRWGQRRGQRKARRRRRIMLGKIFAKIDKTEKAPSARAKQIPQIP